VSRRAAVAGALLACVPRIAAAEAWTPDPFAAPAPPPVTAAAAYVYDATSGTALFALDAEEPRPPASLAKIATSLVVLENGNLDDEVTIEEGDLVDETQSRVGLLPGDVLTVRDLLYGLMIPSGSDAAKALGRHVGAALPPAESGDPSGGIRVSSVAVIRATSRLPELRPGSIASPESPPRIKPSRRSSRRASATPPACRPSPPHFSLPTAAGTPEPW